MLYREENSLVPAGNLFMFFQPISRHYTAWAIPAPPSSQDKISVSGKNFQLPVKQEGEWAPIFFGIYSTPSLLHDWALFGSLSTRNFLVTPWHRYLCLYSCGLLAGDQCSIPGNGKRFFSSLQLADGVWMQHNGYRGSFSGNKATRAWDLPFAII
jgi:hypothetical protein